MGTQWQILRRKWSGWLWGWWSEGVVSNLSSSCIQVVSKLSQIYFQVVPSGWGAVVGCGDGSPRATTRLSPSCLQVFPSGWGAVVGFEGGSLRAGLWPRAGSSDHATLTIPSSWALCSANLAIPTLVRDTLLCYPIPSLRYSALFFARHIGVFRLIILICYCPPGKPYFPVIYQTLKEPLAMDRSKNTIELNCRVKWSVRTVS